MTAACKVLVNAAGPWVEDVLSRTGRNAENRVRLIKGSHIVTRKFWEGEQAYLLQHDDKRVIFVNPYEGDLALIGTTDIPFDGRAEDVHIAPEEVEYLLSVVKSYFEHAPSAGDVIHAFSGVRPLYDDKAANPSAVTRDYVFDIDAPPRAAPMLSVFGGKITTYRKLAEHALEKLTPYFPQMSGSLDERRRVAGRRLAGRRFCAIPGPIARPARLAAGRRFLRLCAPVRNEGRETARRRENRSPISDAISAQPFTSARRDFLSPTNGLRKPTTSSSGARNTAFI